MNAIWAFLSKVLFQRRNEQMRDGNGGGIHDTNVADSIPDVSRRDDETNAHVPDPTHVITQPEDETKNPVDVERNEDGGKDLVLGPTHITEPVSDHHENLPLTDSLGIDINAGNGVETNQASVPDPAPITQPENESRRRKKRAPDWEPHETEKLIESKLQNLNWDQISDLIPGRPSKGCRQRWETIGRPYKKVKKLCNDRGEDVSQVTEEDLRSMKMGTIYVRNRHWFKMVDDYYSFKSGVLPNDLNGAIMPIGTVGENALPVAPIVALPNVITTAPPVQATADPMAVTVAQLSLHPASLSSVDAVDPWTNWNELFDAAGDGAS